MIILRELTNLKRIIQMTPAFFSKLQQHHVLPRDQLEQLQNLAMPPHFICFSLLMKIADDGPHAFEGLVRALLGTNQLEAARRLNEPLAGVQLLRSDAAPTTPAHSPEEPSQLPRCVSVPAASPAAPSQRVSPTEAVSRDSSEVYTMTSRPRGHALIISNIEFPDFDPPKRLGGEVDETELRGLLRRCGFEVTVKQNLNRRQMCDRVADFASSRMHDSCDMAVLAILTHGKEGVLYGVDSRKLDTERDVIACFSNSAAPLLAGKPKWLIFQACRGEEQNTAYKPRNIMCTQSDGVNCSPHDEDLPAVSDLYITYSTIPGYTSLRDTRNGTLLVQTLCQVFTDEYVQRLSLTELHTRVHRCMNRICVEDRYKQTIEDTRRGWSRSLYFNPGQ